MGYYQQIMSLRYFWWSLVCNDFRARYRRSFLGVVWSLARPIGMTCVLCVVFSHLVGGNIREYAPFLFAGVAVWQFLTESVLQGCRCFIQGAAYLRQQKVPVLIFPLRTVLGSAIHLAVSMCIAVVLSVLMNGVPNLAGLLAVIPGVVILICIALSLATIFGLIHTHIPDTSHLLEIGLQALYFLTPVIYPARTFSDNELMRSVLRFNPLTSVLEIVRQPLLYGQVPELGHWATAATLMASTMTIAWWCLRKMERNLVYWV